MEFKVTKLTVDELNAVDGLMKLNSSTLGFLPREALRDYFNSDGVLGAKSSNGELVGYLLYASQFSRIRIVHLCVYSDFKGRGIARKLIESLVNSATTQTEITLRCRRDYPAHVMWPKLRFIPISEFSGRAQSGSVLTCWRRPLQLDSQLSLFQARTEDETVDVVIDSQIFFDLSSSSAVNKQPYRTLTSNLSIVPIKLWKTDELYTEIDRNSDSNIRETNRQNAHSYPSVLYDPKTAESYEETLSEFLPSNSLSQKSDIRHLAISAASDVSIFITKDNALLNKSNEIKNATNLQLLSPTNLIIKLHELLNRDSYTPDHVSGLSLLWCRLTNQNFPRDLHESFLIQGEKLSQFRQKLDVFLADPNRYLCELLSSKGKIVAIRVVEIEGDSTLVTHFCRIKRSTTQQLFAGYLVASTVYKAVVEKLCLVKFTSDSIFPGLVPELIDKSFVKCDQTFVRFCFSSSLIRDEVLEKVTYLCPEVVIKYSRTSDSEIERYCSPLNLLTNQQNKFLIPIRQGYAMSLINCDLSAEDLFGGQTSVLLRWANVYYRKRSHHKMLNSPARILWYVSGGPKDIGKIMAISSLDEIVIGTPKILFRKFAGFGILDWNDIFTLCEKDINKEIMVIKFSHTFPFRNQVDLNKMQEVYREFGQKPLVQSPSKLKTELFNKIFQLGFSG